MAHGDRQRALRDASNRESRLPDDCPAPPAAASYSATGASSSSRTRSMAPEGLSPSVSRPPPIQTFEPVSRTRSGSAASSSRICRILFKPKLFGLNAILTSPLIHSVESNANGGPDPALRVRPIQQDGWRPRASRPARHSLCVCSYWERCAKTLRCVSDRQPECAATTTAAPIGIST